MAGSIPALSYVGQRRGLLSQTDGGSVRKGLSFVRIEYAGGLFRNVPIQDYESIRTQLTSDFGGPFIEGTDCDGSDFMLHKEAVIAISKSTPEIRDKNFDNWKRMEYEKLKSATEMERFE